MSAYGQESPRNARTRPERRTTYRRLSFFGSELSESREAENQPPIREWPAIARNRSPEQLEQLGRAAAAEDLEPENQSQEETGPWPPRADVPVEHLDLDSFDDPSAETAGEDL